jgi:GNAT superfamily N-acetyltransferase
VTFRAATVEDVPALLALVTSAYRGEPSRAGWTTEADLLDGQRTDADAITAIVTGADSLVLVAEEPGDRREPGDDSRRIVACCQLERHGQVGYFGMFAVRPAEQAGGLGSAVLAEAERYARDAWGARRMEMYVIAQRAELIAWYARRGYATTGETKPFPYGDERFGLPKRPDLAFTVLSKALGPAAGRGDPAAPPGRLGSGFYWA